jgi:hypothetical protein
MCRRRDRVGRAALALLAAAVAARAARADDAAPYATVVRAAAGPPQPVSVAVDAAPARQLAGTGGDPSLVVQDLPGAARPAPGATGVALWGAAPAESRVLFDGVEIPALYHYGGFRSTIGAELPGRIEVVPGAYGADYGRALGGVVRVDPRPLDERGTHLALDANLLDASLSARAGAARGPRLLAAARASYLDATYGRYAPAGATALFPVPRYGDAQVEAAEDVGARATVRALALASFDRARRDLGGAALGLPDRIEDRALDFWRAALSYAERGDDDGLAATLSVGGDRDSLAQSFGPVPASEEVTSAMLGLRARYGARLAPGLRLAVGFDGLVTRARVRRAGSLTVPAREGDVTVFGQPPGDDTNADDWTATVGDLGPFVTASFTRGRWTLAPGLRGDAFPVDGSRALPPVGATPLVGYAHLALALDPRLAVACEVTPALVLTAAAGLYHQPVDPRDLSAVFGAPGLGPARAAHATLSARARLGEVTTVEVAGFYRRLDGLAVRSPLPAPALAGALSPDGRGRSAGASLLVRRELARGTLAWLSYTLGRSERWTGDGPARLFDLDQTHVLAAVASHERGAWVVSGRVRYATGMPRTPVVGSVADLHDGGFDPLFGAQNSARLPAFFEADARVDRVLFAGPVRVTVYLDVENVTARRNPEEIVYTRDYGASGYLTGPPLLGLVGLRIES